MQRRTLDALLATGGLIVAAILLVVGGLATWAGNFVSDNVTTQLSAQQIFFPKAGSPGLTDPKIAPYLTQYAGQQLTTGDQARAYADHFIAVHVAAATGNRSYAQVSAAAQASPKDESLIAMKQTAFQGETLRGLLLNAYAFGTMGKIATYAAWTSFIGAALLFILGLLGIRHLRTAPHDQQALVGSGKSSPSAS
jgi:hypothetical protein